VPGTEQARGKASGDKEGWVGKEGVSQAEQQEDETSLCGLQMALQGQGPEDSGS
jgi:hypothetical protein